MESLSSKEFFEQLKTNSLKPSFTLKGIVKKSEKDSEVLFARKGDFGNWVTIPSSMIESANVLKTFSKENETFTVVKLQLKTPTTPEGEILYKLLSATEKEEMDSEKCAWKNKLMGRHGCHGMMGKFFGGGGLFGHHCGCHHGHCGESEDSSKQNWKK